MLGSSRTEVDDKGPLAAVVQALRLSLDRMEMGYTLIVSVDEEGEGEGRSMPSREFGCGFSVVAEVPPYETPEDAEVLSRMLRAIEVSGLESRLVRKTSTSDMNIIRALYGVPCIAYGPGNPRLSHTTYERIRIQDYLKSIEVLCRFLEVRF